MSIAVSKLVWDYGPQNPSDTLMLLALADFADHTGYCWPGVDTLARMCRVSRRSAQRTLRRLEDEGFIKVVVKGHGRLSNRYQMDLMFLEYRDVSVTSRGDVSVTSEVTSASPYPSRNHHENHQQGPLSPWLSEGEGEKEGEDAWR